MNYSSLEEQRLIGNLIDANGKIVYENIQGLCKFNKYDLPNSYICFDINPSWQSFVFENKTKTKFHLAFLRSFHPTCFKIEKIEDFSNINQEYNIYESGCIEHLMYFDDKIEHKNINIEKISVPKKYENKGLECFYRIKSIKELSDGDLKYIFLILSTITGCKFFLRYSSTRGGFVTYYYKRVSKSNQLIIPDTGRLFFPMEFKQLFPLRKNINEEFLNKIFLLYTSFCVEKEIVNRLIKGYSLLDYFLEIFKETKNYKNPPGKTKLLVDFIYEMDSKNKNINKNVVKYLKFLFKNYPKSEQSFKDHGGFDFFEYRNRYLHRGELLLNIHQVKKINTSIFSLNEILRIIILNIANLGFASMKKRKIIESREISESIKRRRELFSPIW